MNPTLRRAILAQTRVELVLTMRRGENVLVTIIVPLLLLVFFASSGLIPPSGQSPMDYLVPGVLSLAIISTGMVNLGIATAYERYYGVLKRLGGSPLPRWGLLLAKALSILALEVFQVALLLGVAILGYGWQPRLSLGIAILALALGTLAFSAIGLAMAGGLRAEATLALANGLFLLFLLLGDVLMPVDHLPLLLQPVSRVLPATALSEALRYGFSGGAAVPTVGLALLLAWTVVCGGVAVRSFRWE
ncbi:MAG TPA: ABC transporter permease [Chloroflexota bacterium]|nr:ABC transporter permease [Chloroflexota bacterium]